MTRSCFSRTVHQRISTQNDRTVGARNLRLHLSGSVAPPTALTSFWSITSSGGSCNSGSIRRRSRMWMNSRSDLLKSELVWSRTLLTLLSMHGETVCMLVFAQRADITKIDCIAVEQRDIWINCQPEWPKCKPNVIYACYFYKVIILLCIKCNISLVLFSPGSVEADVGWGG